MALPHSLFQTVSQKVFSETGRPALGILGNRPSTPRLRRRGVEPVTFTPRLIRSGVEKGVSYSPMPNRRGVKAAHLLPDRVWGWGAGTGRKVLRAGQGAVHLTVIPDLVFAGLRQRAGVKKH